MKKFVVALGILSATLGLSVAAFAQGAGPRGGAPRGPGGPGGFGQRGPGGPGGPGGMMERRKKMQEEMFAKLGLNAAQKKKVKALDDKLMAHMKDVFTKAGGDRSKVREEMMNSRKAYDKDLKGVLTPAQWKKLEDMRKEMRAKMGRGPGGPGGFRGPGGPGGPGGAPGRPGGKH